MTGNVIIILCNTWPFFFFFWVVIVLLTMNDTRVNFPTVFFPGQFLILFFVSLLLLIQYFWQFIQRSSPGVLLVWKEISSNSVKQKKERKSFQLFFILLLYFIFSHRLFYYNWEIFSDLCKILQYPFFVVV